MTLLGYSTTFAQIECLKLCASPKYNEKKIGYLGLTQLLDEDSEVLMMVTHSIKKDLAESQGQFIVSLALTALCEVSTSEMCREMLPDIQKLIASTNLYIRKKATMAAIRILRKVPDMVDEFGKLVENLLGEKNHGVQLATYALMREILQIDASYKKKFRKLVGTIIKAHKSLLSGGYTPDYDISGIMDPFLQVHILHVLRLLGDQSPEASEEMYDLLTQLASNPDTGKSTANAILYETARTIVSVESSPALKVLGINILGKFLANKDSNTRYVALNLLKKVVTLDYDAVQRHKATILDCVKENDVSIRKGALDLLSQLVNKSNVKSIVKELINILIVAEPEFQADLAATICWAVEQFSPSVRWQIDTVIKVLTLAGNYVKDEHIYTLIHLITAAPEHHMYSVHSTWLALRENLKQEGLVLFGMWMIGEFGHYLSKPYTDATLTSQSVNSNEILQMIEEILNNPKTPTKIRDYALTALVKLSIKLPSESTAQINTLIVSQMNWPVSEVQQRALEYSALMDAKFNEKRVKILEPIPLSKKAENLVKGKSEKEDGEKPLEVSPTKIGENQPPAVREEVKKAAKTGIEDLLDMPSGGSDGAETKVGGASTLAVLEDVFKDIGSLGGAPATSPVPTPPAPAVSLLGDLTDMPAAPPATVPVSTAPPAADVLDLFGNAGTVPAAPSKPNKILVEGYKDDHINIDFEMDPKNPQNPQEHRIVAYFNGVSENQLQGINLLVAVQKHMKISLQAATGTSMSGTGQRQISQEMKITNTMEGVKPISVKIKITYSVQGNKVENTKTITFPMEP